MTDTYICGGSGELTPEAKAELREFADYLKSKANARKLGVPHPTFERWRDLQRGVSAPSAGAPND